MADVIHNIYRVKMKGSIFIGGESNEFFVWESIWDWGEFLLCGMDDFIKIPESYIEFLDVDEFGLKKPHHTCNDNIECSDCKKCGDMDWFVKGGLK